MKTDELKYLLNQNPLWSEHVSPIWLATRFCLKRNLAIFPFPHKMEKTEKTQLLSLLKPAFNQISFLKKSYRFSTSSLNSLQKEALSEHFLMRTPNDSDAYIIDASGCFLILIDDDDHLSFHCLEEDSHWIKTWEKLSELEGTIGKLHPFAFTPQFGYLTSDPSNCGTSLKIQAFLHLPCLTHLKNGKEVLENELIDEVRIFGLGENNQPIGDIVIVENQFSLGLSEEHIRESIHKVATKLMNLEETEREKLKNTPSIAIQDKICRAYGLLRHSYQIETTEAFSALSLLKLAINLKWVTGIEDWEMNRIFFQSRRGHMLLSEENLASDQLATKRAEYLKTQCQKITLNFHV